MDTSTELPIHPGISTSENILRGRPRPPQLTLDWFGKRQFSGLKYALFHGYGLRTHLACIFVALLFCLVEVAWNGQERLGYAIALPIWFIPLACTNENNLAVRYSIFGILLPRLPISHRSRLPELQRSYGSRTSDARLPKYLKGPSRDRWISFQSILPLYLSLYYNAVAFYSGQYSGFFTFLSVYALVNHYYVNRRKLRERPGSWPAIRRPVQGILGRPLLAFVTWLGYTLVVNTHKLAFIRACVAFIHLVNVWVMRDKTWVFFIHIQSGPEYWPEGTPEADIALWARFDAEDALARQEFLATWGEYKPKYTPPQPGLSLWREESPDFDDELDGLYRGDSSDEDEPDEYTSDDAIADETAAAAAREKRRKDLLAEVAKPFPSLPLPPTPPRNTIKRPAKTPSRYPHRAQPPETKETISALLNLVTTTHPPLKTLKSLLRNHAHLAFPSNPHLEALYISRLPLLSTRALATADLVQLLRYELASLDPAMRALRLGVHKPLRLAARAADDARLGQARSHWRRVPYGGKSRAHLGEEKGGYVSVVEDESARWPASDRGGLDEGNWDVRTDVYALEGGDGSEDGVTYPFNTVPRRGWGESLEDVFRWEEWGVWRARFWTEKLRGVVTLAWWGAAVAVSVRIWLALTGVVPLEEEFGSGVGIGMVWSTWQGVGELGRRVREESVVGEAYLREVGGWWRMFFQAWGRQVRGDIGWQGFCGFVVVWVYLVVRLGYGGWRWR